MSKVNFPVPYQIQAKYGRNRNAYPIVIADSIDFDIREVSKQDTSLVATVDMTWATGGLPGQGPDGWQATDFEIDNKRNPTVEVRKFEDSFYVPLMKFSLLKAVPATPAGINDLIAPINGHNALYCPLHAFYENSEPDYKEWLLKQANGTLPLFREASIKSVSDFGNLREEAISNAERIVADVILLDGTLWQRLASEPRITFKRELRIIDDERVEGVMTLRVTLEGSEGDNPFTSGEFNLSRVDDCFEHVREHFPGLEVLPLLENLTVVDEAALKFSGEVDALVNVARKVHVDLEKDNYYLTPQLVEFTNKLKWELKTENVDAIVDLLSEVAPHLTPWPKISSGVKAAIDRWNMRPINLENSFRL
jgi:hypothetical protein